MKRSDDANGRRCEPLARKSVRSGRHDARSLIPHAISSYYDVVIYTDVGEFLIPDPDLFSRFKEPISASKQQFMTAPGVKILHAHDQESKFMLESPIISHRKYARFAGDCCKNLVSRVEINGRPVFRKTRYEITINPHLYLFHLNRIDRRLELLQIAERRKISWFEPSLKSGHSYQFRYNDDELLSRMFPFKSEQLGAPEKRDGDFHFSNDLHSWMHTSRRHNHNGEMQCYQTDSRISSLDLK
ncbi:hypothetical protein ACRAWG_11360 [Methylobacterium sp. P31]